MEALQKKRQSISSQIKLLENSTVDPDVLTGEHVSDYHSQIVSLRKENVDFLDLISVKSSDDNYEQQFFELAERINKIKVFLDMILSKRNDSSILNQSMPALIQGNQMLWVPQEVRLPRLDPPVFSGDLHTWLSFHDLFNAIIHNNATLTGAQKLQYLKASLKGESALLIQSIPITDANYEEAWGLLLSRYKCKREIVRAHLERLVVQPSLVGESPIALRKLIDTTSECVRSLDVMTVLKEDMFNLMVIHLVSKKLDPDARLQLEKSLDDRKLPSLESFIKFLDNHARVTAVAATSSLPRKNLPTKFPPVLKNVFSMCHGQVNRECEVCKSDHLVLKCESFLKLTVPERIDAVKRLRLCFNCLRRGHGSQQCSSGGCRKCQKPHHTLIHIEASDSVKAGKVVFSSQATDVVARHQVLLATALVKVCDVSGSNIVCRALLDSGSRASFITERCVQSLSLPRKRMAATVTGVAAIGAKPVHGSVQLVFTSMYTQEVFETEALVMSKITNFLPNCDVDVSRWSYLKGLQLADSVLQAW